MFKRVAASTCALINGACRNVPHRAISSSAARTIASKVGAVQPKPVHRGEVVDGSRDYRIIDDVLGAVNQQIATDSYSRLFAVVYLHGKQFKVTAEDLIAVRCHMPLDLGETIALEKVLLVGGTDFSIIGRPVIDKNVVRVFATVVEKTLDYEFRRFHHVQRTRLHRSYFFRDVYTVLRINGIQLLKNIES